MCHRPDRRRAAARRTPPQGHPQRARRGQAARAEGRRASCTCAVLGEGRLGAGRASSRRTAQGGARRQPRRPSSTTSPRRTPRPSPRWRSRIRRGLRRRGRHRAWARTCCPAWPRASRRRWPPTCSPSTGRGATSPSRRPMWAGNVIAEVKLTTPVKAFTVRATEFAAAEKPAAAGRGEGVPPPAEAASCQTEVRRLQGSEERPARADRGQHRRLRRPRHQGRLQGDRGAGRRARRGGGRLAARCATRAGCRTTSRSARPARWSRPQLYIAAGISRRDPAPGAA